MQTVSKVEEWKEIHKQTLLNESFVEVSLDISDPDAHVGVNSQDNGAIYISDSSKLTSGEDITPSPYCTLEQNLWCLDGNRKAIPESEFGDSSYASDVLSDDTCIFSSKVPIITIELRKVFTTSIPGITITWSKTYGEWADNFVVIAYNGENVVAEKEVVGNRSMTSLVFTDITSYDRVVILVKKWCLPNHRARVEEIILGIHKVYGKTQLFNYSHKQTVDPISTSLPKVEIKFSVDNVDGEYNPYNLNGLAKYLMERQEVKARYGFKMNDGSIEWIKGGTFYLSEWYAKQNDLTADFTARDIIEYLSLIYYDTEYYDTTNAARFQTIQEEGRSLYGLAEAILESAGLPLNANGSTKWFVSERLEYLITKAPLPEDTCANCLQLIANAGGCVMYQDREGILRIEPMSEVITDYEINQFNSYSKSEITLSKPIKDVTVNVYRYSFDADGKLKSEIREKVTSTLGKTGESIIIDNPLITGEPTLDDTPPHAQYICAWIRDYLRSRMTLDSSWRADVRLDALDIVTNKNDYNTSKVCMTDVEFKYNGAFSGTGKGRVIGNG